MNSTTHSMMRKVDNVFKLLGDIVNVAAKVVVTPLAVAVDVVKLPVQIIDDEDTFENTEAALESIFDEDF